MNNLWEILYIIYWYTDEDFDNLLEKSLKVTSKIDDFKEFARENIKAYNASWELVTE
jgi:hypothetical protein